MQNKYLFDGQKLMWHMDRVEAHFKRGERIVPLHIDLGVTKFCNAACVYCYGTFQKMGKDIIEGQTLINLFSDAARLGVRSITVTGDGEPSLNPAMWEAMRAGKAGGLDIGFATNGIALDEEKIKCILENCVFCRFNVSAVSREGYIKIHGVDKWDVVKKNIESAVRLKKELSSNCTLGLQMVLIPDAYEEIIPEANYAVEEGLDYFVIKQFSDPGCDEMSRFALDWYDRPDVLETLKLAESFSTNDTKIVPKWDMMHSKGVREYDRCVDCALIFQISGSSKCYPCGYLFGKEEYCYGDLKKQTLEEILTSEHYWKLIKHMREDFDVHKNCMGCCRHDFMNAFMWKYLNPPEHLNFV